MQLLPANPGHPETHRRTRAMTRQRAGSQPARAQKPPLLAELSPIPSLSQQLQFGHSKHRTCRSFPLHSTGGCGSVGAPLPRPAPPLTGLLPCAQSGDHPQSQGSPPWPPWPPLLPPPGSPPPTGLFSAQTQLLAACAPTMVRQKLQKIKHVCSKQGHCATVCVWL